MRIVAISDTHTRHKQIKIPPGDVLIHAGDFSGYGHLWEAKNFFDWLVTLPHKHKVVVAGNHDRAFEMFSKDARALVPSGVVYLQDEEATVGGLKIYGSPWQPFFLNWAFNVVRGELWRKWQWIPEKLDILITHGPPSGNLGGVLNGEELGDEELYDAIMKKRPRLHVSGHIHGGHGRREKDGIIFVNAAICTEEYAPTNPPIVVDL